LSQDLSQIAKRKTPPVVTPTGANEPSGSSSSSLLGGSMMKRFPKPWFRPSRKTWFVTLEGKQFNLGGDRKLAFERYKALLNQPREIQVAPDSLAGLIDKFLDWCQKHRATETYEWYRDLLQKFAKTYPDLAVGELKPFHVQEWIDRQTGIKNGTRRNYARAIIRVMWRAQDLGYIDKNPLARFKKPKAGRHSDVTMVSEVYSHLSHAPEFLRDAMRRATATITT
jgi:integrase/recombinase XerD